MIRYRKLYPLFWEDEKVQALGPLDKLLAIYISDTVSDTVSNRAACGPGAEAQP